MLYFASIHNINQTEGVLMSYEVEINGVTYVPKPELRRGSCEGCIAEESTSLCSDISDEGRCQISDGVIWIKKEKPMKTIEQAQQTEVMEKTLVQPEATPAEELKYTVEEVLGAIEDITGYQCWHDTDEIKEHLAKQDNPEYKLYLELKAKFGE